MSYKAAKGAVVVIVDAVALRLVDPEPANAQDVTRALSLLIRPFLLPSLRKHTEPVQSPDSLVIGDS